MILLHESKRFGVSYKYFPIVRRIVQFQPVVFSSEWMGLCMLTAKEVGKSVLIAKGLSLWFPFAEGVCALGDD